MNKTVTGLALLLAGMATVAGAADAPQPGQGTPGGRQGGMTNQSAEDRFKQLDANKDGKVSLDEYSAGRMGGAQGAGGQAGGQGGGQGGGMDRAARFKALDKNSDSFLSLQEYQAGRAAMGQRGEGGEGRGQRQGQPQST